MLLEKQAVATDRSIGSFDSRSPERQEARGTRPTEPCAGPPGSGAWKGTPKLGSDEMDGAENPVAKWFLFRPFFSSSFFLFKGCPLNF